MASVAAGCVVSNPPDYGVAKQTVPVLDVNQAAPNLFVHQEYQSGTPQSVSVPVRSEDTGDPLYGALYLDYKVKYLPAPPDGGTAQPVYNLIASGSLPAGTLSDKNRSFIISWTVPPNAGCHTLSLVVTHFQHLDKQNHPSDPSDIAIVTWWINIDNDTADTKMADCPSQGAT